MNIDSINQFLAKADSCLSRISVKGDDVFTLAEARKWMKLAFDGLNSEQHEEGANDDGG